MLNSFDAIAYINLKHRKDRKAHILSELSRLHVQKNKIKRIDATYIPFNGHLGCVLSHIEALNFALESNLNNILILEDDCFFIDDVQFLNGTIEYFFKTVDPWDVFLFGGYYDQIEKSKHPYINRIKKSYRAHAYAVNKKYFSSLKNHFLSTRDKLQKYQLFYEANKDALDRTWNVLQEKDLWYASNVLLTGQINDFSDIGWETKKLR
ncbi:MAG: glycosyltransferase family 25 protein [Parachlamydiales bacterium]|jgi:hypothetical protein